MSDSNSERQLVKDLNSRHHASTEKFDYFMCSVAGGLFAYIAQTLSPEKITYNSNVLTFGALGFLAASFYFAYKRIQFLNLVTGDNQTYIQCKIDIEETAKKINHLTAIEKQGSQEKIFDSTGGILTQETCGIKLNGLLTRLAQIQLEHKADREKVEKFGWYRDLILFVGFICIFAAKLLQWLPLTHFQ
jgi:hypothetical protein